MPPVHPKIELNSSLLRKQGLEIFMGGGALCGCQNNDSEEDGERRYADPDESRVTNFD